MKTFFFLLATAVSFGCMAEETPLPPSAKTTPIHVLLSPSCPLSPVWVEATVSEKIENDTYFIQDTSKSMILFLPTDELAATPLTVGSHILIYGTVDISPVTSAKNELYAEKIIFPQCKN